jgi:hypothetical protein
VRRLKLNPSNFSADGARHRCYHPLIMGGQPRTHFLPCLDREFYQGDAVIHWTLTVFDRTTGWLNGSFHLEFSELLLHAAVP